MKHFRIAGGAPLETKDEDVGFDELKSAFDGYHAEATKAAKEQGEKLVALQKQLEDERKEREDLEARLNRSGLVYAEAKGDDMALAKERSALGKFIKSGDSSELIEMKALSVGNDPNGGYLVLPTMSNSMATKIFDQSAVKRLARVVQVANGDAWEEIVDKDEPDAEWVGETQARNETSTPGVEMNKIPLHELTASPRVTQKILDTSYLDIGAWLEGKVEDKFGRTEGVAFVSGNGILQPKGFLTGTPVTTGDATRAWGTLQYFASGGASGFSATNPADKLKDMVWGLRAPYRRNAVWLMNSNTASQIDKFKDGMGNYIWRDGMTAGAPPSLLGYPVEFDENMPDVGAGEFPIAFGNFNLGYVVVELNAIRVLRDPFIAKPHVVFFTYKRVGGGISNSEAIKLMKVAAS